jgi:hypothetical protein
MLCHFGQLELPGSDGRAIDWNLLIKSFVPRVDAEELAEDCSLNWAGSWIFEVLTLVLVVGFDGEVVYVPGEEGTWSAVSSPSQFPSYRGVSSGLR